MLRPGIIVPGLGGTTARNRTVILESFVPYTTDSIHRLRAFAQRAGTIVRDEEGWPDDPFYA